MAFAFVIMGIVFGAFGAAATLALGGSILLAILAYSCVGTMGAIASVGFLVWLQSVNEKPFEDTKIAPNTPVSA